VTVTIKEVAEAPEALERTNVSLRSSRLRVGDLVRVGSFGLRTRRLRTALSILGVAIGIAAMVAVLGLSASSREGLQRQIRALGTNLLQVQAGAGFGRGTGELPATAVPMVSRIGPVSAVSSLATLKATVRRTDLVSQGITDGIGVFAADADLASTLKVTMQDGTFLSDATTNYPTVVLGSVTAQTLGISDVADGLRLYIAGEWYDVIGIMEPVAAAPGLDRGVVIGYGAAKDYVLAGVDAVPGIIYVRTQDGAVDDVRNVLPATVNPQAPEEVEVSRPSDALAAQGAADTAFTSLLLALGGVALLVGGIGIANVMVIAVIERRIEIGLRRALGATRAHIRRQFLTEAVILAGVGGLVGVTIGAGITAFAAHVQGWPVVIPPVAIIGGVVAALVIGAIAGLYPAARAARLPPTVALRSS
jgi:putative ABC transport system permease protein